MCSGTGTRTYCHLSTEGPPQQIGQAQTSHLSSKKETSTYPRTIDLAPSPLSLANCLNTLSVSKHLMNHLEQNNILTDLNHGFRCGCSCETQLVITLQDLCKNHDNGKQTDVAILDFAKAFDTVLHTRLLHKIYSYGITGNLHR